MRAIRQKPVTIQLIAPMMLSIFSAVSFFIVITSLGSKINYSVLSAITGSFFAALLDGINPAMSVSSTLMAMRMIAAGTGRIALKLLMPVRWCTSRLMGMHSRYVTTMPSSTEVNPIMMVSALNILETSRLDAPMARRIPISLVRSWTEISVMTPIMMEETISEMATNAIST